MTDNDGIYLVYRHQPSKDGVERRLLGKFHIDDSGLTVLEDHGLGADLENMQPGPAVRYLHSLQNGMYTDVVALDDILQGHRPDLIPSSDEPTPDELAQGITAPEIPSGEFEFVRQGHPPQQLCAEQDRVYIDGHPLTHPEVDRIKELVANGQAKLTHTQPLHKSEAEPFRHSQDSLVPGHGNLHAWKQFKTMRKPGVYVHINGNDIGDLNDVHGLKAGNEAVAAIGRTLSEAAAESVGKKASVFHIGGDSFAVHSPGLESAAAMVRNLRQKLESRPPIRGSHKLSVSAGFGDVPEAAESAMLDAKKIKYSRNAPKGRSQTEVAALVPGQDLLFRKS